MASRLRLDFDTRTFPKGALDRVQWVCRMLHWTVDAVSIAQTRRGWHVEVVTRQRIAPVALVAAQAMCGSDYKREVFNLQRARRLRYVDPWWREPSRWNVLYHRHYKASRGEL